MAEVAVRRESAGIVADGAFKVVLGVVFVAGAGWAGGVLGVSPWLTAIAGLVLAVAGGVEIRYVNRRARTTYLRLMVAYDLGWALTAVAGLLLAWQGNTSGGEVWIVYQAVAPVAFVVLLLRSRR
ncbi:hypothetical protein [Kribbella italica]|uniref:Uncharacterized protein n=1 Tax=Kribbella italica TaxID=1540520 RepID=A0A7W9J472_9ACTN|nr:hypothetical protein [Kribbella italica]MBB5835223.1 hypothetical protein [Kribbella italica]